MEETKKKEKKGSFIKKIKSLLALVLVAVVSVVGTLAYLSTTEGPVTNTFVGSDDIGLEVQEPSWTTDDDDVTDKDGYTLAQSYTPGLPIPKDPLLKNTTTDDKGYAEWVAIRVDYYVGEVPKSYEEFAVQPTDDDDAIKTKFIDAITFNDNWFEVASPANAKYDLFIYKTQLGAQSTTAKLFEQIVINNEIQKSNNSSYPALNIYISGAAIKYEESLHASITDLSITTNNSTTDAEIAKIKTSLTDLLKGITVPPASNP